jgi:hypothetical protein
MTNVSGPGHEVLRKQYRLLYGLGLLLVIPIGLTTKFLTGSGPLFEWWRDSGGDLLYQIALMLVVLLVKPNWPLNRIAWGAFLYSSAIEFTQLIKTPWLDALRPTVFGKLVLGSTFVPMDFVYYFLGSWLGWWLIRSVQRLNRA